MQTNIRDVLTARCRAMADELGWDGVCVVCGHDWAGDCHGDCTCIACTAQRQELESRPPSVCFACGGPVELARTPDEAACGDCGRRHARDSRYGWIMA